MGRRAQVVAGYKRDIAEAQQQMRAAARAGNDSEAERIQDNLHQLRGNLRIIESLPEGES